MRGDAEAHSTRVRPFHRVVQHELVGSIDIGLGVIRCLRPIALLGLDLFHREVRALDQSDLDTGSTLRMPVIGPFAESFQRLVRVGDIGLQHDPGAQVSEFRLIENANERLDRQVQIAVFLHVEIDEGIMGGSDAIQRRESIGDAIQGVVPGEHVEVRAECRDLDRHVVDIRAAQSRGDHLEAVVSLVIAEDRLAEHVDVEIESIRGSSCYIATEGRVLRWQDDAFGFAPDAPVDGPFGQSGCVGRDEAEHAQPHAIDEAEGSGHAGAHQVVQAPRGALAVADAQHLIGEVEQQISSGVVADETTESPGAAAFGAGGLRLGASQQRGRPGLGLGGVSRGWRSSGRGGGCRGGGVGRHAAKHTTTQRRSSCVTVTPCRSKKYKIHAQRSRPSCNLSTGCRRSWPRPRTPRDATSTSTPDSLSGWVGRPRRSSVVESATSSRLISRSRMRPRMRRCSPRVSRWPVIWNSSCARIVVSAGI